jgi:cytochrome P450
MSRRSAAAGSAARTGTVYWDPFDVAPDEDPYPVWAMVREQAPVYRKDRYDFWALSRFDDLEDVAESHIERVHTSAVRGYRAAPILL